MKRRHVVSSLLLVILLCLQIYDVQSHWWTRRRRRRRVPAPQNCQLSGWGSWQVCSNLCSSGNQIRTRSVRVQESWGGTCYALLETRACGSLNGCFGSGSKCDPNTGKCSCSISGYVLKNGKKCVDENECKTNNGKGPCDQICSNTVGSYKCSCNQGYSLSGQHGCTAMNCGAIIASPCPPGSYKDSFSNVCKTFQVSCLSGTKYLQHCTLSCSSGYKLGKITSQSGKGFGEDYQKVDFTIMPTVSCALKQGGSAVHWDKSQEMASYFCRRNNDPPYDIILNGSSLPEHSPTGFLIGSLSSKDHQPGQIFTYTVQSPSVLFTCQGQSLKNIWKNPDLHGAIPLVNNSIQVRVRSTDNGSPVQMWLEKTFAITILDVNDPPFNISLSNYQVLENATVGSVIGVLKAVDGDDPPGTLPYSDFVWRLTDSSNGKFALNGSKITVAQKLDHEAQNIRQIKVTCTDKGTLPKSSNKDFIIFVQDINEHPVSLTLSSVTVDENSKIGTKVGVLQALDEEGDPVTFNISQSVVETQNKFALGVSSCNKIQQKTSCQADVTVKGDLDYESQRSYQLVVLAKDKSGEIMKEWTLSIINVNEKPSTVNLTGSHVNENTPAGTVVGYFMVTDPDNKNSITQTHSCQLQNSQSGDNLYFIVDSNTVLKVKGGSKVIDYETKKTLSITVSCFDNGSPSLSIDQIFNITVKDINEPPTSLSLSSLSISENSPYGTVVGTLSSDDPEKSYQSYTYSIEGPEGAPFVIGGSGGIKNKVLVNGTLDFEMSPVLDLVIRVTDSGQLFKEETFKITLINMNDPPTDIKLPGHNGQLSVKENSDDGVFISDIKLVDQDIGTLPVCSLDNDAGGRVKMIDGNPHKIVVGPTTTDYESSANKQLKIKLNCSDGSSAFVTKEFDINILDVNELATEIQVPNSAVPENDANATISIVTVIDPDIGQSHKCVVCDVIPGQPCHTSQYFEINSLVELKTKKTLNFEAKHHHNILISCNDTVSSPQHSLTQKKSLTVTVTDVNEQPSSACTDPIYISMDDADGAVIATLHANDPDNEGSIKQKLSYSMSNKVSSAPFVVRDNRIFKNGDIAEPLNYTLNIKVTDDGRVVEGFTSNGYLYTTQKPLYTTSPCYVIATKTKPTTEIRLSPNTVSAMATDGTVIGTFTTTTANPGESISYQLLNEDDFPFTVDGNKLKMKLRILKFLQKIGNVKEMFIYIKIQSTGSRTGTLKNGLYVRFINDAPPVPLCLVQKSIGEHRPTGTIAGQLLIEESEPPEYLCSMTSCCAQVGHIPAKAFTYKCMVSNPDDNSVIVAANNITSLFYVDERYLLRNKVPLTYADYLATNGTIDVSVTCHDIVRPLHVIGQTFAVNVLACYSNGSCPSPPECGRCYNDGRCRDRKDIYTCLCKAGFTGNRCEVGVDYCAEDPCQNGGTCLNAVTSFRCSCAKEFSGVLCDRNANLCTVCEPYTSCVKFVDAGKRCLSKEYQVPILVDRQTLTEKQLWEIEKEIAVLVEENKNKTKADARKRRSASIFYVENLKTESVTENVLLYLALMDSRNGYEPLLAKYACALLANTKRHCVDENDCRLFQGSKKTCPVVYSKLAHSGGESGGLDSGGTAGVALAIVLVVVALLIGAIFYYKRKYKVAKYREAVVRYRPHIQDRQPVAANFNASEEQVEFSNPTYGEVNNAVPVAEMARDRIAKENLVGINLDPTSVRKRNDIKVNENVLYRAPNGVNRNPPSMLTTQNPLYAEGTEVRSQKRLNNEDEKHNNAKTDNLNNGKTCLVSAEDGAYEDLDAVKAKQVPEDCHDLKTKVSLDSAEGSRGEPMELKTVSQKGKKQRQKGVPLDEQPRYEDTRLLSKRRPRDRHYENFVPRVLDNPVYDSPPVLPEKHIYDNLELKPQPDVSGESITNPLYEFENDVPEGTGDLASGRVEEPLYEVIPANRKEKRKSFLKSVSTEKEGYEEMIDNSGEEAEDEIFDSSKA